MDDDFANVGAVMAELLNDFNDIERSAKSIEQVINFSAQYIQKRLGLYSVIVTRIDGDSEVFQAAFGSNKEYCDRLSERPPRIHKISTSPALSRLIRNGQLMASTAISQVDIPSFLPDQTVSEIWLPIKKQNMVLGIIKLGSRKIIQVDKQENSDNSKVFFAPYEKILDRITKILENNFG